MSRAIIFCSIAISAGVIIDPGVDIMLLSLSFIIS
jgi:hypothetical protein